jgi:hypothetical protein
LNNQEDDTVTIEVEEQLENVFGESEETRDFSEESAEFADYPLRNLKAISLSIDWEIDDEIMTRLNDEVEELKEKYKDDNVIVLFLRLLGSVGKYIKVNKASSHPDAIKLLNTVFINLEKVAMSEGMSETDREKILLGEVKRFKKLKEDIAIRKTVGAKEKEIEVSEEVEPMIIEEPQEVGAAMQEELMPPEIEAEEIGPLPGGITPEISDIAQMQPHEAFAYALDEIRQVIKAEFKALRAEIKLWREGQ